MFERRHKDAAGVYLVLWDARKKSENVEEVLKMKKEKSKALMK